MVVQVTGVEGGLVSKERIHGVCAFYLSRIG